MVARIAVALLPALCMLGGCGAPGDAADLPSAFPSSEYDDGDLRAFDLAFDFDGAVVPGDVVPGVASVGTAHVHAAVVTSGGGELTWVPDRSRGWAVRAPVALAEGPIKAAAIVVWPDAASLDDLEPGRRTVRMEVDFVADEAAPARQGDDGDNLVQWGRFGDPAQVKLQVDHGKPSCRAVGSEREVLVSADRSVLPHRWYRLTCTIREGAVRLRLTDLEGGSEPGDWTIKSDPGAIVFGRVPLSIGAKVGASGRLDRKSVDQFNGVIDRVVIDVG